MRMYKPNFAGGNQYGVPSTYKGLSVGRTLSSLMVISMILIFNGVALASSDEEWSNTIFIEDECNPRVTINNDGPCTVSVYHWLPAGDVSLGTIAPYSSRTYTEASEGEMYRVTSGRATATEFNESYTASGCNLSLIHI